MQQETARPRSHQLGLGSEITDGPRPVPTEKSMLREGLEPQRLRRVLPEEALFTACAGGTEIGVAVGRGLDPSGQACGVVVTGDSASRMASGESDRHACDPMVIYETVAYR